MDILRYKKRTDYVFQDEFLSSVLTWELLRTLKKTASIWHPSVEMMSAW